jgi:GT2 family glycosyltransferase
LLLEEPESRGGMYAAINTALREFSGLWSHFTYINDDDLLTPGSEKYWQAAITGTRTAQSVTYGVVCLVNEASHRIGLLPVNPFPRMNRALWWAGKSPCSQVGMVISRQTFQKIGFFDDRLRYAGDMEYILRMESKGCDFVYRPEIAGSFRIRHGQLSADRSEFDSEICMIRQRYGLEPAPRIVFRLLCLAYMFVTNIRSYFWHVSTNGLKRRVALFDP